MDSMFYHEDIIVETVSSTKIIEKGNIAPAIASSKQTEDITTKKGRKRRNTDISDIKLSCKKTKATSPFSLTTAQSNECLEGQSESLRSEEMRSCGSNSTIVNQVSNRRCCRDRKTPIRLLTTTKETNLKLSLVVEIDVCDGDKSGKPLKEASSMILKCIDPKIKIIDSKDPNNHTCMFNLLVLSNDRTTRLPMSANLFCLFFVTGFMSNLGDNAIDGRKILEW